MARRKPRGECVFCEREGELTNEDAWPLWLRKIFGVEPVATYEEINADGVAVKHRERKLLISLKVPRVCAECNNVWLSQIEARTIPVLRPLILGYKTTLGAGALELIATWFTKTGLTLDLALSEPSIPAINYHAFYRNPAPLDHSFIILSSIDAMKDQGINYFRQDAPQMFAAYEPEDVADSNRSQPERAYLQTFRLGYLVVQIFWANLRGAVQRFRMVPESKGHTVAWPNPVEGAWPLSELKDFEAFRRFGNRMRRFDIAT